MKPLFRAIKRLRFFFLGIVLLLAGIAFLFGGAAYQHGASQGSQLHAGALTAAALLLSGVVLIAVSSRTILWLVVLNPRVPEDFDALMHTSVEASPDLFWRLAHNWASATKRSCPLYKPAQMYAIGKQLCELGARYVEANDLSKQEERDWARFKNDWLRTRIFLERNRWPKSVGIATPQ